jgi:hypothetical protein
MKLSRLARYPAFAVLAVVVLLIGSWCSGAIWYRCGCDGAVRVLLAGAMALLSVAAAFCLATRRRWPAMAIYCFVVGVLLLWWISILPAGSREWAPDVAQNATAAFDGDRVVVGNVRNFTWRSETDFDPVWEKRSYALSHVTEVDLIMSYWMGEAIAHTIVSVGFDDGNRLAFSIEIRKEVNEVFSPIAGFFKEYELAIVAADERDVVRLRSNVRGEDVRIYRMKVNPGNAQRLLRLYLEEANDLARTPRFYNTLTSNCTTLVFDLVKIVYPGLPLDGRIILSGYLPDYAYELGATNTHMSFDKLRELSKIRDNALRADTAPNFSAKIREGVPPPL